MIVKWKTISLTASLSAILLLGAVTEPQAAELHNGSATTQASVEPTSEPSVTAPADKSTDKATTATSKKQKSVLDAESLERPLSFLKDITSGDDEDSDISISPSTMMLALKALVATLLSTII